MLQLSARLLPLLCVLLDRTSLLRFVPTQHPGVTETDRSRRNMGPSRHGESYYRFLRRGLSYGPSLPSPSA